MEKDIFDYLLAIQVHVRQAQLEINNFIENSHHEGLDNTIIQGASQLSELESKKNLIYYALSNISVSLGNSYAQIKEDIVDNNRLSWAGTAHEIREVLSTTLRLLAPDEVVFTQPWYKQDQNTSGPTQKQRVHYILLEQGAGSKEGEVVEQVVKLESMIEDLVRLTYARASDAAHRFKPKSEVARILRYFEAFAYDLLNLND